MIKERNAKKLDVKIAKISLGCKKTLMSHYLI